MMSLRKLGITKLKPYNNNQKLKTKEIKAVVAKHVDDPKLQGRIAREIFSLWKGGTMERLEGFVDVFNEMRGTKFKATPNLLPNFDYWMKVYTPFDMIQAVENCDKSFGDWMYNGFSPTKLLRRKNASGSCDYIGDLLNHKPKKKNTTTPQVKVAR